MITTNKRLREALAELVALRDLKTFAAVYFAGNETALRDYARRLLPAWEAARAALAQQAPTQACHWKDCPHGSDCVHASEPAAPADARDERPGFEQWAIRTHGKFTLSDPDTGAMWLAWKARAAIARQAAAPAIPNLGKTS